MNFKFHKLNSEFKDYSRKISATREGALTARTAREKKLESVVMALETFLKENSKQPLSNTASETSHKIKTHKKALKKPDENDASCTTRSSITEDWLGAEAINPPDWEKYVDLMQTEMEGGARLLSLNLQKQELQIQEKLAERELWGRRNRRRLQEEMMKGKQLSILKPKSRNAIWGTFSATTEAVDDENFLKNVPSSRDRLQKYLLEFTKSKSRKCLDTEEDEDEIEEIDLEDGALSARQESVNLIYKEKIAEIDKVQTLYKKEIDNCEKRKLPSSIIQKLRAKKMIAIKGISEKYNHKQQFQLCL